MKYVDVVIDNKSEYMDSFFTYLAPDDINVGDKVSIPLARKPKGAEGYVVSIDTTPGIETDKVKEIISIDKDRSLTPEIIDTAIWMRSRYGVKYIDAIQKKEISGTLNTVFNEAELQKIAGYGNGRYFSAQSPELLTDIFNRFIQKIPATPPSMTIRKYAYLDGLFLLIAMSCAVGAWLLRRIGMQAVS